MTLVRVLEPEVMDTAEEAHDYNSMDHAQVNRSFVDDLLATVQDAADILDLGTGTALIPIELCERTDRGRVMAVDLSVHMLELARYNIEVAGLVERIQLGHVDSKQLPYQDEMFDSVVSNSIVHHIPEPLAVLQEGVRVAKSGGVLFFRDLMRPTSDAEVCRLVETYAGCENEHQQQMFEDSLRAALDLEEIRELVDRLGFAPETVQSTSDRHWTWIGRKGAAARLD